MQTVKQTTSLSGCHTDTIFFRLSHRHALLQAVTQTRSIADSQTDTLYCRVSKRHSLLQTVTKKKKKKKNSITWKLTHVKVRMGRTNQSLQNVTATLANLTSSRADLHSAPTPNVLLRHPSNPSPRAMTSSAVVHQIIFTSDINLCSGLDQNDGRKGGRRLRIIRTPA